MATTTSAAATIEDLVDDLLATHDPAATPVAEFLGARFDRGLAWVWFPERSGGLGLPPEAQVDVDRLLDAAGAPKEDYVHNVVAFGPGAGAVAAFGTPDQRRRWLRRMFTNEDIWCQLFSEPGAGSDLANVATRAVRDGDEWVVDGQKVWTTLGHVARWAILVARTDPDLPKHKGLTFFVLHMDQPGVEVRPLRQMTGDAEFNEVFMTGARIPDADRLGEVGQGWAVAMAALMAERVSIGGSTPPRGSGPISIAVDIWNGLDRPDPAHRDRLMDLWVQAEVLRLTNARARTARSAGTPGPEGSAGKLQFAELNQAIFELCVDLLGADGLLLPQGYAFRRSDFTDLSGGDPRFQLLRSRANTLEGGSAEVLRNIMGERVLGLPGEPRVDRDVPWSQSRT